MQYCLQNGDALWSLLKTPRQTASRSATKTWVPLNGRQMINRTNLCTHAGLLSTRILIRERRQRKRYGSCSLPIGSCADSARGINLSRHGSCQELQKVDCTCREGKYGRTNWPPALQFWRRLCSTRRYFLPCTIQKVASKAPGCL